MSREIKMVQGDLNIQNGKLQTLEREDKLKQQILKILYTLKGSTYHPNYGSDIFDVIGRYEQEPNFLVPLLRTTIEEAIIYYQQIQLNQELLQVMTDEEILMRLENLEVERADTTGYVVKGTLITRASTNAEFVIA